MSLTISALVVIASLSGLLLPSIYSSETVNWTLQAKGQDVGNLLAVPALLASAVLYARGSWRAGQLWLGVLLYLIYAYVVYAMAVHFNPLFLVYVAVLGLSGYAALYTVDRLRAASALLPPGRFLASAAATLLAIGMLFALLWLAEVVPALLTGQPPASLREAGLVVNPIHVIDLAIVLPAFLLTGVGVLRGRDSGRFWLGPWLVFSVLMGASIVAAMILMAFAGTPGVLVPGVFVSVVVLASAVAGSHALGVGRAAGVGSGRPVQRVS